jgi:hypothetical protein
MSDDVHGIVGDRRRNPFPSMTETEYQLFRATIREDVTAGVTAAMTAYRRDNCEAHVERTEHLEAVVFGRTEKKIKGLDARMEVVEAELCNLIDGIKWSKRLVYSSLVVGTLGLLFGLIQLAIIGK